MKPESELKISRLVIRCLEFTRDNITNFEAYPTVKEMFIAIEQRILLPEIRKRPQEKNLVYEAARQFMQSLNLSLERMKREGTEDDKQA